MHATCQFEVTRGADGAPSSHWTYFAFFAPRIASCFSQHPKFGAAARLGRSTALTPIGVRTPVVNMSMRALMGMVQAF